jgi:hypothetical protein
VSGYLDRLAARAIGAAPIAEPVIPSLFEPSRTSGDASSHFESQIDRQTTEDESISLSTTPSTTAKQHPSPAPREEAMPAQVRPRSQEYKADSRETTSVADERPQQPRRATLKDRAFDFAQAAAPISQLDREQKRSNGRSEAQISSPRLDLDSTLQDQPSQRAVAEARPVAGQTSDLPPVAKPSRIPNEVRRPNSEIANPQGQFSSTDRGPVTSANDSLAPIPDIRINIGRIEIRAVHPQPAAPPTPTSRQRPPLSIHDYLKQRGERR